MPRAEGANGRPKALKTITGSSMSMDHSRSKRMICKKSIQSTLGMWMIWLSLSSKTTQTQRKTPMLGLFKAFKHSLEKRKKKKAGIMFGLCCMLLSTTVVELNRAQAMVLHGHLDPKCRPALRLHNDANEADGKVDEATPTPDWSR